MFVRITKVFSLGVVQMGYDYLIIGAGIFGSVFAREMKDNGKKCLVIDKRPHIGGNCYTERIEGIDVHKYGAHIFHTNSQKIWEYVNRFTDFIHYQHEILAKNGDDEFSLPFNMNTFEKMWGIDDPEEIKKIIAEQSAHIGTPRNLEEQAIKMVGTDIYEKLIKNYTKKQWNRDPKDLPASIIKRLPLRFIYDNNYFNDKYQGIPVNGYTEMFNRLLDGIDVRLSIDFFENRELSKLASKIIYTGAIDQYFDYCFGKLEYRSLRFEEEILGIDDYQGRSVVNYTDDETPFTRIIEHKHFTGVETRETIITREYPLDFIKGGEPYYPIGDSRNLQTLKKYKELAEKDKSLILGGRLANYKYYDIHQVIGEALVISKGLK